MSFRAIASMHCSCGGELGDTDPSAEEEKAHGCGRPGCCVEVYQCQTCSTRVRVKFEAPEMEDA